MFGVSALSTPRAWRMRSARKWSPAGALIPAGRGDRAIRHRPNRLCDRRITVVAPCVAAQVSPAPPSHNASPWRTGRSRAGASTSAREGAARRLPPQWCPYSRVDTGDVIRLVATDLDGTFWGEDQVVPAAHLTAAEELIESGVTVLAATSRRPRVVRRQLAMVGLTLPAVLIDGALGVDFRSDERFHQSCFDPEIRARNLGDLPRARSRSVPLRGRS